MSIEIGALGRAETVVNEANTAAAVGSGLSPVFATPCMAALMENAAVNALSPFLGPDEGSVGTRLDLTHDAATPMGVRVWAEARVTEVDRRRVVLAVTAYDEAGQIGGGVHERFIIDPERFLAKAQKRKEA